MERRRVAHAAEEAAEHLCYSSDNIKPHNHIGPSAGGAVCYLSQRDIMPLRIQSEASFP